MRFIVLAAVLLGGCGLLLGPGEPTRSRDAGPDGGERVDGGSGVDATTDAAIGDAEAADADAADAGGGDSGAVACFAATDIVTCNDLPDPCGWYACSDQCLPTAPIAAVCGCAYISDPTLCGSEALCRWDTSTGRCIPASAGISRCIKLATETDCEVDTGCLWIPCTSECRPSTTSLAAFCGCRAHTDSASCATEPSHCQWACATACVPATIDVTDLCAP